MLNINKDILDIFKIMEDYNQKLENIIDMICSEMDLDCNIEKLKNLFGENSIYYLDVVRNNIIDIPVSNFKILEKPVNLKLGEKFYDNEKVIEFFYEGYYDDCPIEILSITDDNKIYNCYEEFPFLLLTEGGLIVLYYNYNDEKSYLYFIKNINKIDEPIKQFIFNM